MSYEEVTALVYNNNKVVRNIKQDIQNPTGDSVHILWNKGRYFETSVYSKELRNQLAWDCKLKVQYSNMFVGNLNQLLNLVKSLNKRGYYADIKIDWI